MTQSTYSAVRAIEIQVKSAEDYFANHAPLASEIIERNYIGKLRTLLNVLASPEAPAAVDDGGAVERMAKAYANDDLNWPDFSEDYRAGCREIARRMLVALPPPAPQGTATLDENAKLRAEVERLEKLVYVHGLLKCKKCGFALIKTTLYVKTGNFGADNSPDHCPNDGAPLWRVTERDASNEQIDIAEKMSDELRELRATPQPDREAVMREAFLFAAKEIERDTCPTSCVCGDCNKLRVVIDHLRALVQSPTPAKEDGR